MQTAPSPFFAYHALEGLNRACDPLSMRVRLKDYRDRLRLTLEAMAERSGFSVSQLSRWEQAKSNIPSERLPELARAYSCRIADIFEEEDSPFQPLGPTLFIKGVAAAGRWAEAWELPDGELGTFPGRTDLTVPISQRFGVRLEGESMNAVYPHGTVLECVSFLSNVEITSGRRVIVSRRRNGTEIEVTVKEYQVDGDGVEWLVPRSHHPDFQTPFRVDQPGPGIDEVQIVGVVVGSYRPE